MLEKILTFLLLAQVISFSDGHMAHKAKILIVPGHEPTYGGAEYYSTKERDLVVEIGQYLKEFLQRDDYYQVSITRNKQSWNTDLANYFINKKSEILAWEKESRGNGTRTKAREASTSPIIEHIKVPSGVALRLYGITKWANDNEIDLALHLHLNDAPDRRWWSGGKYSGVVLYTPAGLYANSSTTMSVAEAMFKRLALFNPISNLPGESKGIITDPELIALGANNTADSASLLIEYDYLYQPQFNNPKLRELALRDYAYQTYIGLQEFFKTHNNSPATVRYMPSLLYEWKTPVSGTNSNPKDIYSLQTALMISGDYPPEGKTKNDCPRTGVFGPCTEAALKNFQSKNNVTGEGPAGPKTYELLKKIYDGGAN